MLDIVHSASPLLNACYYFLDKFSVPRIPRCAKHAIFGTQSVSQSVFRFIWTRCHISAVSVPLRCSQISGKFPVKMVSLARSHASSICGSDGELLSQTRTFGTDLLATLLLPEIVIRFARSRQAIGGFRVTIESPDSSGAFSFASTPGLRARYGIRIRNAFAREDGPSSLLLESQSLDSESSSELVEKRSTANNTDSRVATRRLVDRIRS